MGAVSINLRTEGRAHWRVWLAFVLIIGIFGGAAIAAGVGARRTGTAYLRYLAWSNAPDLDVGFGGIGNPESTRAMEDKVFSLPQVAAHWSDPRLVAPEAVTADGKRLTSFELAVMADPTDRLGVEVLRPKIIEGRMFDPRRTDEAVIARLAAKRLGIRVGDRMTVRVGRERRDGIAGVATDAPHLDLQIRVVGIMVIPQDLAPTRRGWRYMVLPATVARQYATLIPPSEGDSYLMRLRHGEADVDAFLEGLEKIGFTGDIPEKQRDLTATVQHSIRFERNALWLLCGLGALVALVILGQALARYALTEAGNYPVLRALGMSRRQLFTIGVIRALVIGTFGGLLAVPIAIALSPLTPIGTARIAEPHPGVWFDALGLAAGAVATALAITLVGVISAWRVAARVARPRPDRARPRSAIADALAHAGTSVTAVTGLRFATERAHGARSVPVPAAALLVALSIAVTTAALTFASGIGVLRDSPDRSGYTWDITLGSSTSDAQAALTKALRADRRVAAITRIALGTVTLGTLPGQRAFAFDDVGSIQPVMLAGRRPAGTDEIALGPETMGEAGLDIGDRVTVASTDDGGLGPKRFRIVGRAITPTALDVWEQLKPGVGALMTLDAARRLNRDIDNNLAYVVRLKKGGDLDAVAASIRDDVPGTTPVVRQQPEDLANLEQVRGIPYVLAGLVAFLGVGTLVHVLAIGVRRRRHDLAILKALGLVRSQVRAVIAWEGALIAAVGLMLGIPVGLAAGRWTWRWFAERLIVVPDPVIPWGALAAIAPTALLLAWLASQLPSRVAAHTRAASLLRAE